MVYGRVLPRYGEDLGVFVASLRAQVFGTQEKAAKYFRLDRTTINRYENGKSRPDLGYVTGLAHQLVELLALTDTELVEAQRNLLEQINQAIRQNYGNVPFRNWEEVRAVANEYITKRREQGQDRSPDPTSTQAQDVIDITFFIEALQSWNESFFRWSEASDHMRSSRAGMAIHALSAVGNRVSPRGLLSFCITLLLSIATARLMIPILGWPLDDLKLRQIACIDFAIATLLIPGLIAAFTRPDKLDLFQLERFRQKVILWLLKFTGALVGFYVFAVFAIGVALIIYYLRWPPLPNGGRAVLALVPLFWGYVVARRAPIDRYEMFEGELRLHPADRLFLPTFSLIGPATALFLYYFYWFLSDRTAAPITLLLVPITIALWEGRKHDSQLISDLALILAFGFVAPSLIILYTLFWAPDASTLPASDLPLLATFLVYFYSWTLFIATLFVRKQVKLTWPSILGAFLFEVITLLIVLTSRWWAVGFTVTVVLLWILWGQKRFRSYLFIHNSFWIMALATIVAIALWRFSQTPLWINGLGVAIISPVLIWWAYRSPTNG